MSFKYTRHFLKKVEVLLEELDYTIRYEKGNFQSGYCIVENRNMAVVNKFFDTEGRINVLLEILASIEVDPEQLQDKSLQLYKELQKKLSSTEPEPEESSS